MEEELLLIMTLPPKRELPTTSKIFPVVDVAFDPRTKIFVVSVGYIIILLVLVDHAVAPPPPPDVRSVCQLGRPPFNLRTRPLVETGSLARFPETSA